MSAGSAVLDLTPDPLQHQWTQDVVEGCKRSADGCVRTLGGRLRHIPKINDRDGTWAGEAERKARNTVPQGSAADIAKTAMVRLHRQIQEQLPGRGHILLMVRLCHCCITKASLQLSVASSEMAGMAHITSYCGEQPAASNRLFFSPDHQCSFEMRQAANIQGGHVCHTI